MYRTSNTPSENIRSNAAELLNRHVILTLVLVLV
jgi:hypothetical protein